MRGRRGEREREKEKEKEREREESRTKCLVSKVREEIEILSRFLTSTCSQ